MSPYSPNILFDGVIYSESEGTAHEWKGRYAAEDGNSVTLHDPRVRPGL